MGENQRQEANDLRLELRARNNVLWHAIFDTYKNVAAFCKTHGLEQSRVGALLNLSASPRLAKSGDISLMAGTLCEITGYSFEELFPEKLYAGLFPTKMVAEVESGQVVSLSDVPLRDRLQSFNDPLEQSDRRNVIDAVLKTLTPREERIVRDRFGLDGPERTLEEIGRDHGVGPERVRQIEAKAIRRLRHPTRGKVLRPLLEA